MTETDSRSGVTRRRNSRFVDFVAAVTDRAARHVRARDGSRRRVRQRRHALDGDAVLHKTGVRRSIERPSSDIDQCRRATDGGLGAVSTW